MDVDYVDWEKIRKDYETSTATAKDLADKYGVKPTTLRSRKNREKWQRSGDAPPSETKQRNVATQHKSDASRRNADAAVAKINASGLTDKQKLFCTYYLQRYNATWAYQQAYNADYATAHANGSRLMANANVKKLLTDLKEQQQADLFLTSEDILREYAKQAFSSLGDIIKYNVQEEIVTDPETGTILDTSDNPVKFHVTDIYLKPSDQIDWSVVKSIHKGRDGLVVELYDKQKAMRELIDRLPAAKVTDSDEDSLLQAIITRAKQSNLPKEDDD